MWGWVIIGLKEPSFRCFCSTCFYMIRFYFSDLLSKNRSWTKKNSRKWSRPICLQRFTKSQIYASTSCSRALVSWCFSGNSRRLGRLTKQLSSSTPGGPNPGFYVSRQPKSMVPKSCNLRIKSKWNGKKSKNVSLNQKRPENLFWNLFSCSTIQHLFHVDHPVCAQPVQATSNNTLLTDSTHPRPFRVTHPGSTSRRLLSSQAAHWRVQHLRISFSFQGQRSAYQEGWLIGPCSSFQVHLGALVDW